MKKRVLVTGGAGFIGSYLCEELLNKGYDVICCDNFYTGNKDNLEKILDNKNFDLLRHDITFPLYLEVDIVLNFACPALQFIIRMILYKQLKLVFMGNKYAWFG